MKVHGWARVIEDRIGQAQPRGDFDQLSGEGPRITNDGWSAYPCEWRLAHHVLRNAGAVPLWVQRIREVRADERRARTELMAIVRVTPTGRPLRQDAMDTYLRVLEDCNRRIQWINLSLPHPSLWIRPLRPIELEALPNTTDRLKPAME